MNLIYPALAQIIWTFVVLILMTRARIAALKGRQVQISDIALSPEHWPASARSVSNNYGNQFESPVLFFALVGIATFIGATGWFMTLLAWIFVASRIVHTYVHTGSNDINMRVRVYGVGMLALFGMLVIIIATLV